jgi:hypothetical protein
LWRGEFAPRSFPNRRNRRDRASIAEIGKPKALPQMTRIGAGQETLKYTPNWDGLDDLS